MHKPAITLNDKPIDLAIEGEFIGKGIRIGTEAETMSSDRRKAMEQVANEGRTLLMGMGVESNGSYRATN